MPLKCILSQKIYAISFWLTSLYMTVSGVIHISTNDPASFLCLLNWQADSLSLRRRGSPGRCSALFKGRKEAHTWPLAPRFPPWRQPLLLGLGRDVLFKWTATPPPSLRVSLCLCQEVEGAALPPLSRERQQTLAPRCRGTWRPSWPWSPGVTNNQAIQASVRTWCLGKTMPTALGTEDHSFGVGCFIHRTPGSSSSVCMWVCEVRAGSDSVP